MSQPKEKIQHIFQWGRLVSSVTEDISRSLLAFIPNGLSLLYETLLKTFLSKLLVHPWIASWFKFVITLGRGIAADVAYFLFTPLGFMIGLILGTISAISVKKLPTYRGQISKVLHRLSGQTVAGALMGAGTLWIAHYLFKLKDLTALHWVMAMIIGAFISLIGIAIFLLALEAVTQAQANLIRKNVQRAKALNVQIKAMAKQKAKTKILMQAQDIIQQVNGVQAHLEDFFKEKYEMIAENTYKKIDRHFNYLTDRACHGDLKALKRLQQLAFPVITPDEVSSLEAMLERMFNARAIAKIKDEVDSCYDYWYYQDLRVNEEGCV